MSSVIDLSQTDKALSTYYVIVDTVTELVVAFLYEKLATDIEASRIVTYYFDNFGIKCYWEKYSDYSILEGVSNENEKKN